jgi:hypothetical protein
VTFTDSEDVSAQHVLACAAEDTATGAHVVWFTGGESYNDAENDAYAAVVYSLYWTNIKYSTAVGDMPSVMYQGEMTPIQSGGAKAIGALLVILPLAFVAFGAVSVYRRKKAK